MPFHMLRKYYALVKDNEITRRRVTLRYISRLLGNNTLITLMCVVGVGGVSYGMLNDDNLVFIIGVLFAIAGYLLIRRKLKRHLRDNL